MVTHYPISAWLDLFEEKINSIEKHYIKQRKGSKKMLALIIMWLVGAILSIFVLIEFTSTKTYTFLSKILPFMTKSILSLNNKIPILVFEKEKKIFEKYSIPRKNWLTKLFILLLYLGFLFIILQISLYVLSKKDLTHWTEIIVMIFFIICYTVFLIIILSSIVKVFIKSFTSAKEDILKLKEKDAKVIFKLVFYLGWIMFSPSLFFAFLYGLFFLVTEFPTGVLYMLDIDNLYYSVSINYPVVNSQKIDMVQDRITGVMKALPVIQVLSQKIIEIGVLGYFVNLISELPQDSKSDCRTK